MDKATKGIFKGEMMAAKDNSGMVQECKTDFEYFKALHDKLARRLDVAEAAMVGLHQRVFYLENKLEMLEEKLAKKPSFTDVGTGAGTSSSIGGV